MSRRLRPIQSYPPVLFDFYAQAIQQGVSLPYSTPQAALQMRMTLYGFRRALLRAINEPSSQEFEILPWMHQVSDVMLSVKKLPSGQALLEGTTMLRYFEELAEKLTQQGVNIQVGTDRPAVTFAELARESAFRVQQSLEEGQISSMDQEEAILKWMEETQSEKDH